MKKKIRSVTDSRKIHLRNFRIMSVVILLLLLYLAFCASGLFAMEDVAVGNLEEKLVQCFRSPLSCWNEKTNAILLLVVLLWFIFTANQYIKLNNNRMPGNEFGSAKWGDINKFNQKYAHKEDKNNRILSENIRFRYAESTLRNNNTFIVGGSGAGKTSFVLTPNLLNAYGSNVITDSKGSTLEELGNYLQEQENTRVYVLNLIDFEKSMKINPFLFLRRRQDVTKLVSNLIQNTDSENIKNSTADPFWEKSERMFLEALFLYVWKECPTVSNNPETGELAILEKNMKSIMYLLDEAQFEEPDTPTKLDIRMKQLEKTEPNHPAVKTYRRYLSAPEDTRRSVIATVNARMQPFDNDELLEIFSGNDIPLDEFGVGKDGDETTKSFLFMVIPDEDTTYNFVPGMVYTLLFDQLYYQARLYGGRLPLSVGFWLDEFANIKMPANFDKIMATCRSRGIYCVPMLQSLAQMKTLFANGAWEGIVGNCDTFLYLGGNEESTFEYITKLLGKWTVDKKTTGESTGTSGSHSENFDVLGRELMMEYEVRLLPDDECILFVRGEEPIRDKKWFPWEHEIYNQALSYGKYEVPEHRETEEDSIRLLNSESMEYYKKMSEKDSSIRYYTIDALDFMSMDLDRLAAESADTGKVNLSLERMQELYDKEQETKRKEEQRLFRESYDQLPLLDIFASDQLDETRRTVVKELKKLQVPEEVIKNIIHPLLNEEEMFRKKEAYMVMNSLC